MATIQEINLAIASGELDSSLDGIINMAQLRKKTIQRVGVNSLTLGSRVKLVDIRPVAFKGTTGKFLSFEGADKAKIRLDDHWIEQIKWGRFARYMRNGGELTVPVSSLVALVAP